MASINKVILVGRLGRDVESRFTTGGKAVANFSIATDYGFGDKKQTEWHRVTAWDKQAEFAEKFLSKGSLVYVEGRIQTRQYEKDGETKFVTEIIASAVQGLDAAKSRAAAAGDASEATESEAVAVDDDSVPF